MFLVGLLHHIHILLIVCLHCSPFSNVFVCLFVCVHVRARLRVCVCVCVCIQLKNLDYEELQLRLSALDPMMEREIEELRQRYTAKRQPILDAMDAKKRRQQNF